MGSLTPTWSAPASAVRSCSAPVRPSSHCRLQHCAALVLARELTHGLISGALKYLASEVKEALDGAHDWIRKASLVGLEGCVETCNSLLLVLNRPLGVLMEY